MKKAYKINDLCRCLDLPSSTFYHKKVKHKILNNKNIIKAMYEIAEKSKFTYGKRRMRVEMRKYGFTLSIYMIVKLMKKLNIKARCYIKRKYKYFKPEISKKNILNRKFKQHEPNKVWVSDITYIRTNNGWIYLSSIMDLYSRKIIAWAFSSKQDVALVIKTLKIALTKRNITRNNKGLILHTDQGSQYTSKKFQEFINSYNIESSMSNRGNCHDNSVKERFFNTLKTELIGKTIYDNVKVASKEISRYISLFYNKERLHSYLGYQSPNKFEINHKKYA